MRPLFTNYRDGVLFLSTDPWRGGGHRGHRADGVGGCDRLVLQSVGQDPDAVAVPAGLQAGAIEGTRYWSL